MKPPTCFVGETFLKHLLTACQLISFAIAVLFASLAAAGERILSFDAIIDVQTDGSVLVTETISVEAEGDQIKRGIFRDIPLFARDAQGWTYEVVFQLLGVEQDGERASYFTEEGGSGIRIYIGRHNVFLEPGVYTYTIRYKMDRQVRFFEDYDEVYWNVTGNEWAFPIDKATARVRLPNQTQPTQFDAYTGFFREEGKNFIVQPDPATGDVVFQTTRELLAEQGLTVAVGFPKDLVDEPSASEKFNMWLQDQRVFAIGAPGVLILVLYYLVSWWFVGRDPAPGLIIPRFKAPDGISPALANYITNRGIEGERWTALAAACLSLAVKDRVSLSKDGNTLVLDVKAEPSKVYDEPLPKGEAVVLTTLEGRGSPLTLTSKNGESIETLGDNFVSAITKEYRGVYFRTNGNYLLPGLIISIITIVCLLFFGELSEAQSEQGFLFAFFTIFAIAISFGLTFLVCEGVKRALHTELAGFSYWAAYALIFCGLLYGVTHLVAGILGMRPEVPLLPVFIIGIPILFYMYAKVIDVPTMRGRKVMDVIDGLKLYLSVAEGERMNMVGAPDMSTTHFEELLPYAVSLGVEKPWSTHFEAWLESATAIQNEGGYQPQWFASNGFDSGDITGSIDEATTAMARSFRSSIPVSSSSGSGSSGGGFSGGGGGGGGGGGW